MNSFRARLPGTRRLQRGCHSDRIRSDRMARTPSTRKWSGEASDALDLEPRVFLGQDPKRIAASLKRSALRSRGRKTSPFQSAMSMLNFYINRAGKNLSAAQKRTLEAAKTELRRQFGRGAAN